MTRYDDNSAEFLRFFVEELAPTVEAMGDLLLERVQSKIQVQMEPSDPGEPIATRGAEVIKEAWRRSRVRRNESSVSCIVFNPAKTEDGSQLLVPIHEYGEGNFEARPTVRPALDESRSTLNALARDALK